jgi:uncharacterized membrane protein (UPF0127 family)
MAAPTQLILSATSGNVICERAEIADTPWRRARGLLGRSGLGQGEGMLLEPAPSIHSAFMRFEFDAIFLDRELEVLRVVERIRPFRAYSVRHARKVLELAAGEAERRGVQVGDTLVLKEISEPATSEDRCADTRSTPQEPQQDP